ncbi:MAG: hypothetical protein DRJ32_07400 [Thermoprotei archaeon]|nr:MAG: hypothetical protein DRJ32_07400 [Thermoprotei archaeon]
MGKMNRWIVSWISIAIVVALILYMLPVGACYHMADLYGIEVVLNKPYVSYNLSRLVEVGNVSEVDYFAAYAAYAYRSHYDERLIVIVSIQGLKYANIRSAVGDQPSIVVALRKANVSVKQLADNAERVRSELNWQLETLPPSDVLAGAFIFTKAVDEAEVKLFLNISKPVDENFTVKMGLLVRGVESVSDELAAKIKVEVEKVLDRIGLPEFKMILLRIPLIKISLFRGTPEQEKYIAVRIQVPLKQEMLVATVFMCKVEYSSSKLNVSMLRVDEAEKLGWEVWVKKTSGGNVVGFFLRKNVSGAELSLEGAGMCNEIGLSFRIERVDEINDTLLNEFRSVLKAIGLTEDLVKKDLFEKYAEIRQIMFTPAYSISEDKVRDALKAELEWLVEKGVISGLSKDDIEAIISSAKLGYSGWNDRLVWCNGSWIPYRLMSGASILRYSLLPPSYFMLKEGMQGGFPGSSGAFEEEEGVNWLSVCTYFTVSIVIGAIIALLAHYLVRRKVLPER